MREAKKPVIAGVVLVSGHTRVWVERGEVHWRTGRVTTVVPGGQVRQLDVAERELTLHLFEDAFPDTKALAIRHRNRRELLALARDIRAVPGAKAPTQYGPPVRRVEASTWPVRLAGKVLDWPVRAVVRGTAAQRLKLLYVVAGLPAVICAPVEPRAWGPAAWAVFPLGLWLLRMWTLMIELDTWWDVRRHGVTVRVGEPEYTYTSDGGPSYVYRFRTAGGRKREYVSTYPKARGGVIRYDSRDPSRVVVPTRIMWLVTAAVAFCLTGGWGVLLCAPLVFWLLELPGSLF
ncbi:hypothetical protein [Streptomyces abikoensis]|uniref:hypothetical protein n=1 Tax=Streptomyces abikoensis TaxID=97398 RepID=UPI0036BAADE4